MTLWIPGSKNVSGLQSSVSNKNYVDQDSPAPLVNGTIDMFAMCILCILIFAPVICTRIEWVNMVDQSICSFCNQLLEHVFQAVHSLPCSLKNNVSQKRWAFDRWSTCDLWKLLSTYLLDLGNFGFCIIELSTYCLLSIYNELLVGQFCWCSHE